MIQGVQKYIELGTLHSTHSHVLIKVHVLHLLDASMPTLIPTQNSTQSL
jgi:hypothetical protein